MAPRSGLRALTAKGLDSIPGGGLIAKSCPTLASPWAVACQAPLSMGFSREEYWSRLTFPSPGDLPDPILLYCRQNLYQLSCKGSLQSLIGELRFHKPCAFPPPKKKNSTIKINLMSFNFFMKLELTYNTVFIFKVFKYATV